MSVFKKEKTMNLDIQYFVHLDNLRRKSSIKVKDFCENICSDRHYRRYLSGENYISQEKLLQFTKKLNISTYEFYNSFYNFKGTEYHKVSELYALISKRKFVEATDLFKILNKKKMTSQQTKEFFEYCAILLNYHNKTITNSNALDRYRKLIDYPNCTNKDDFTFMEISVIDKIALLCSEHQDYVPTDFLFDILYNKKINYVSSNTRYYLPSIYSNVAMIYGMKGDIQKSIDIAIDGISYSLRIGDNSSLINLYYLVSYGYKLIGSSTLAEEYATYCISTCISKKDDQSFIKFNNLFKREQGFELEITKKRTS